MSSSTTQSANPSSTTYLHVRSKDGDQLSAGYNTHFTINLASAIRSDADQVINISMISASIPYSFYPVSDSLSNNKIIYDDVQTFTLPEQNYDPYELVRVINADATFGAIFTASYNYYTNKLTLTNSTGVNHTLNWSLSNCVKVLGYVDDPDVIVAAAGSSTSSGMIDFATIHSIILRSNLAQGNVLSTNAGQSSILQKININSDPYGIIYLDATDIRQVSLSYAPAIDKIEFRLEDQNGKLLQLSEINYEFSLLFEVFHLDPVVHAEFLVPESAQRLTANQPQYTRRDLTTGSLTPANGSTVGSANAGPYGNILTPPLVNSTVGSTPTVNSTVGSLFNLPTTLASSTGGSVAQSSTTPFSLTRPEGVATRPEGDLVESRHIAHVASEAILDLIV